jgi:hypothetical protein
MSLHERNGSRSIKRARRTKADITRIKDAILEALDEDHPMTVRQLFYRLVSAGVIDKTETEYKTTVGRLTREMRRAREIPFDWLADNTRWMRKPTSYSSVKDMLIQGAQSYRRDLWADHDAYVEVWLEKDALAGVMYEVTESWDVPLMVTRGYPSLSYLHAAAEAIEAGGKPAYLYYFGDYDPSGVDITRAVEQGIREFAPGAEITFERVAVTLDQIIDLSLATKPTKTTDSRCGNYEGESVEVDAIPPAELRRIVEECITGHVDQQALEQTLAIETAEKATMQRISRRNRKGR